MKKLLLAAAVSALKEFVVWKEREGLSEKLYALAVHAVDLDDDDDADSVDSPSPLTRRSASKT